MQMAWLRNMGFFGICLLGLGLLVGRLPQGLEQPSAKHKPLPYATPEIRELVDRINTDFEKHWRRNQCHPKSAADSWLVLRRLSLALTGTIPSLEEIRLLEQVPESERLDWWLDRLLTDRRSSDYLAERFARALVGVEEGPFLVYRRRRFVNWLSDQIFQNRPYNDLVAELIAGTGIWTDAPAVNFITVTTDVNDDSQPDEERLAARTARAFLGIRLDCVQCHDDNLGGSWKQQDFQQLAAFYATARSSLMGIQDQPRAYEFTYLNQAQAERVPARVPFAKTLHAHGSDRQTLAHWVTHAENRAFHRATVNRMWALLFGRALMAPIDNLPLDGPFAPGLELLAEDFARHNCDLRRLIYVIAMTRPFQIESREAEDRIEPTDEFHWDAFPLTRLRPEQMAGSVLQASSLKTINADSHILLRLARFEQENEFVKRYGDTGEDEFDARGGTIPQRLLMMNGKLVQEHTKDDFLANAITRIAALTADPARALEVAYWTALTRAPDSSERQYFLPRLESTSGPERRQHLEDLYWTIFNSREFSWNH
jgi:hypothetical protein